MLRSKAAKARRTAIEKRVVDLQPDSLHQRVGLVFGSAEEVARIENYHLEEPLESYQAPLFGKRGLFAATTA